MFSFHIYILYTIFVKLLICRLFDSTHLLNCSYFVAATATDSLNQCFIAFLRNEILSLKYYIFLLYAIIHSLYSLYFV